MYYLFYSGTAYFHVRAGVCQFRDMYQIQIPDKLKENK